MSITFARRTHLSDTSSAGHGKRDEGKDALIFTPSLPLILFLPLVLASFPWKPSKQRLTQSVIPPPPKSYRPEKYGKNELHYLAAAVLLYPARDGYGNDNQRGREE